MKRWLATILAVVTAFSWMAIAPASAVQMQGDQTFGHISEYKDFYTTYKSAVDAIAESAYRLETSVNVKDYQIPLTQENMNMLHAVITNTHPELFYVVGISGSGVHNSMGQAVFSTITFSWGKIVYDNSGNYTGQENYTAEQVQQMQAEFHSRAQWYLDKVDDSMSDFDKALVLHDALALNAEYLITGATYDLMVNGQGKCYGYSECYAYLLAQVGIDSEIVESRSMNHQWNKVKLDGAYYHVDVTWDDPINDRPGKVGHTYFLLSDSAIEGLSGNSRHYNYVSDYPSTDTRFDNKNFHGINTQFCYVGDNVYAVNNDSSSKSFCLYDAATDSFTVVQSFSNMKWSAGGNSYWIDSFIALEAYDGYLYMNTPDKILVYDTATGTFADFADNTYTNDFYGVRVIDGKVYGVVAENPRVTGTLQYVGDCLVRPPVTGDLDGDDAVSVTDATMLQRYLSEFITLTDAQLALADADGDGKVNIRDVTHMQRQIAELI